jgi:iron complex outermembrane receptor protein
MKIFFVCIILWLGVIDLAGQSIRGKVIDADTKVPLPFVSIYLPDLKSGTTTDTTGYFLLKGIPKGNFFLEISYVGYASRILRASTDGPPIEVSLSTSITEMQELVVTGSSSNIERAKNPVTALPVTREALLQNAASNLIDGLAKLPGISQLSTGPAISKPIIRGLGYNRVVVLRNGMRQEGQQWGDEHGVELDEYEVDRIEIIKGPGSLLYGSDAMAGVVNFLTPRPVLEGTVKGEWLTGYQSNGNMIGNSLMLAGNKKRFNWQGRISQKKAGNYSNAYDGKVLNSGFEEYDGSLNLGINRSWGYSQLQFSSFNQKIGLVEGERDANGNFTKSVPVNGDSVTSITVSQNDMRGYANSIGIPDQKINHNRVVFTNNIFFGESNLLVNFGWQQNRRREYGNALAPDETSLHFLLNTFNADVKYFFPERNDWKVTTGLSSQLQNNRNFGTAYIIPEYQTSDVGLFGFIQRQMGEWFLSGGLRYDYRHLSSDGLYLDSNGKPTGPSTATEMKFSVFQRDFSNVTGSAGVSYQFSHRIVGRVNLSRGFRMPNLAELGSNGRHEGTFRYEVGNASLKPETSLQADAGVSINTNHVSVEASLFYNHIQQYIFLEKVKSTSGKDSIADPLNPAPVFNFVQGNAELYGGEISVDIHPHPLDWLHFENSFSFVRGVQLNRPDSMRNLPFMPPPKLQTEIRLQSANGIGTLRNAYVKLDGIYYFRQDLIFNAFGTETMTPDYLLINAGGGFELTNEKKKVYMKVFLAANNVFDIAYQSHLSRLKYAPVNPVTGMQGVFNAGRNFTIKIIVPFGR